MKKSHPQNSPNSPNFQRNIIKNDNNNIRKRHKSNEFQTRENTLQIILSKTNCPDLLLEERGESNFKSFSANNIYEWNIDVQMEYNIMNTLQHMTIVATTCQTSHECSKETIIDILVAGFSLKDLNGKVITNDDNKEIRDVVNTLIFTIAQHFIGNPSLWKDRSTKLLSNLKCRTSADFRWYRDTFLTRVYTKEDSQQPFWKEKFLAGLPRSLGDKVRNKTRSQSVNGDIPYESLSYGQLISYVQKSVQNKRKNKILEKNPMKIKLSTKRDFQEGDTQHKPSTSKEMETPKPKLKSKITCYNRGKQGHISKYCRLKRKLRNLNLELAIEEQINNLLIETSKGETDTSSSILSDENLNIIQQDDQLPSMDDDNERQINTLTREQDLLFEAINSILDPRKRRFSWKN
ncbi:hypothetical protein HKD37_01G002035 [Glycine soja]